LYNFPNRVAVSVFPIHILCQHGSMRMLIAAFSFAMLAMQASAQDFKLGLDAYDRGDFETALKEWQPLAEQGDARAQFNLGVIYFNGQGIPHDPVKAVDWYRAAADQGYGPAQANLSFMYETGQGLLQNYVEAYKWATLAGTHGADAAGGALEQLAAKMTAEQIAEAKGAAAKWRPIFAETAAPVQRDEPAPPAATNVAAPKVVPNVPAPPAVPSVPAPQAVTNVAAPQAVLNVPTQAQIREAQLQLNALGFDAGLPDGIAGPRTRAAVRGYQEQNGLPVTGAITGDLIDQLTVREPADKPAASDEQVAVRQPDEEQASAPPPPVVEDRPVQAADCDRGAAHPADAFLPPGVAGVVFEQIDADRAIKACELALAQNVGAARYQFQLGRSLHRGERFEEAVVYYQQAGLQGHVLAQKSLGFTYANGLGVTQDYAKAAQWHHMAADQGDADAQHNLGFLYASGRGVEADFVQAHMWYNIAAAHGSGDAAENRDLLARNMTERQIAEAERRALEWIDQHPESAGSR
jgi:TPR repeat protein